MLTILYIYIEHSISKDLIKHMQIDCSTNVQCNVIATNLRVVVAQRQQRGLVAVTIRGSVLFCSSAI